MKTCLKCLVEKPTTDFRYSQGNADGLNNYCKECAKVHPKAELIWLGNKVCTVCKNDVLRIKFRPNCSKKLQSNCIDCECGVISDWRKREESKEIYRSSSRKSARKRYAKNPKAAYWGNWPDSEKKDRYALYARKGAANQNLKKVSEITDRYVLQLLFGEKGIKMKDARQIPHIQEIIETKRAIIQLNRERKKLNTL